MSDLLRVRFLGPLEPYALGFAGELDRQGYTPLSAKCQLRLAAHLSRWLTGEELGADALTTVVAGRFLAARRDAGHTGYLSVQGLEPLLCYLRGIGAAPAADPPERPTTSVDRLLDRYGRYLAIERGLCTETIYLYIGKLRPFLVGRLKADSLCLADLTAADVTAFMVARCPGLSKTSARLTATALRSLLGFLHVDGIIAVSLSGAVPSVASWRLQALPRALEIGQVASLLASCDRLTEQGRRDFAIVTLLARLGLRSGEVASMQLDDILWRAGEIVIRGKADRRERLPLPVDVGEAVAAYLHDARPASAIGRSVFVRVLAPHRQLTPDAVSRVVVAAGRRCGMGPIGAHRLRHTAATEMLRGGALLPQIGQVLRHRSMMTTAIYAKVDREALRSIAQPWPGSRA